MEISSKKNQMESQLNLNGFITVAFKLLLYFETLILQVPIFEIIDLCRLVE